MKTLSCSVLVATALLLVSASAQAQSANETNANSQVKQSPAIMDADALAEWEQSFSGTNGIRATHMLDEEVFGPEGEEIGEVDNVILGPQGQIIAMIAEVGGFWDINDTHIAVPWNEVTLIPDGFKIPVTEENFDNYTLFADNSFITMEKLQQAQQVDDTVATGAETWRISALLGDYVALENGVGFGYLDDVIFSKDGTIQAVIVQSSLAAYGYSSYAFPFHGYASGWRPSSHAYVLPYGPVVIDAVKPFHYSEITSYWF